MQVKVFSPRRKHITCEVAQGESFGAIRARLGKELGIPIERGLILHQGETVKDDETASGRLQGSEEVLFFMEIADPPKPAPQQTRGGGMFGFGGGGAGRGAGLGMPAGNSVSANLAASLMQRLQQAQQQPGARSAPAAQTAMQQQQQQQQMVAQELVKQLTEMGFSKARAVAALRNSSFDLIDALQWLEEHADDPDSAFEGGGSGADRSSAAPVPAPAAPPSAQVSPQVLALVRLFEPVLRAVALVATGNTRPKQALEETRLPAMESDGWKGFHAAVHRIWAGERNASALKVGLDANTSVLVDRVLELVALGAAALSAEADEDTWVAMARDPEFDVVLQQLQPMLQRMAKFAVESTKEAYGQGGMVDEHEETQLKEFVDKMEAAQYQLRTGWEMVCAGVREVGDLFECVSPLANGKPDDKSSRLLRTLVKLTLQLESE